MKKILYIFIFLILVGCKDTNSKKDTTISNENNDISVSSLNSSNYRNIYEIDINLFYDSDSDGTGDISGIIKKLDYLKGNDKSLGVNSILLNTFFPLNSNKKTDVLDFYSINKKYGTLENFDELIQECKKRDIQVLINLPLISTSNKHPWFLETQGSIDSKYKDYYFFSDKKIDDTYYDLSGTFYKASISENSPNLNLDNAEVKEEIKKIAEFWINKGVNGFKLNDVKYYFPDVENNKVFLDWFYDYCKSINNDFYIIGEVWGGANETLSYYDTKIPSFSNFGFATKNGSLVKSILDESAEDLLYAIEYPFNKILERNKNFIDINFLSNADIERSSSFFENDLNKMKLASSIYLLKPGNPIIYFGEEIGMLENENSNEKKENMIWSSNENNLGIEEQLKNPESLLNHYKNILKIKEKYPEIAKGNPISIELREKHVALFSIRHEDSSLFIAHNLSSEYKLVELPTIDAKLVENINGKSIFEDAELTLPPYSTAILK